MFEDARWDFLELASEVSQVKLRQGENPGLEQAAALGWTGPWHPLLGGPPLLPGWCQQLLMEEGWLGDEQGSLKSPGLMV